MRRLIMFLGVLMEKPGDNREKPAQKNAKKKIILLILCGGDPCCYRLDLGFDDLDPAGRVNGLDCLEEIS